MALYPRAVLKLIPPSVDDPRIDPDLAVLHVDAGNASSLHDWFVRNGKIESHFLVKLSGVVEQYRDTAYQADAQVGGAKEAVSIETQGLEHGLWTDEQLEAIKDLLLWLHEEHPRIELRPPAGPYDAGVGYHSMWSPGAAGTWARDGRTCPGPDRRIQYRTVLVPWMGTNPTQEDDVSPTPSELFKADVIAAPVPSETNPTWSAETYLRSIQRNAKAGYTNTVELRAELSALTAAVQALAATKGVDPAAIAAEVGVAVRERLAQLTVHDAAAEEVA